MSAIAPVGAQSLAPSTAAPAAAGAAAPSSAAGATPTAAGAASGGEVSSTDLMKAFLVAMLLNSLGEGDQQKNDSGGMLGLLLLASMGQSCNCGFAGTGAAGAQQAYGANAAATQPAAAAGIDAAA